MNSAAVVIGSNDYTGLMPRLTSPVNDALAFRDLLVELGLVAKEDITLLTAPAQPSSQSPTRKRIADALFDVYADGDGIERFYFYYSGHGLLTYSDAAQSRTQSVLVPVDVENLDRDGGLLISLDELLGRFKLRGPAEQMFVIDACRNLGWQRHPDVGSLGWSALPATGTERAQAALFAASRLGEALAVANELGVMTRHLLDALRGSGVALDFSDLLDSYVVTPQSVLAYVRDAVAVSLRDVPLAARKFMVPQLSQDGPELAPFRHFKLDEVVDLPLTMHIEPDDATAEISVTIRARGFKVAEYSLPPRLNHEEMRLPPQRYKLAAASPRGTCVPAETLIDVRREHEARFSVVPPGGLLPVVATGSEPRGAGGGGDGMRTAARVEIRGSPGAPLLGTLEATAHEGEVTIEVDALEPPYRHLSQAHTLRAQLPAGTYRVGFRLGNEVFCQAEVEVDPGEVVTVEPTVALTPLLREALGTGLETPSTTVISESIGEIQAGVLPTMLPIIGIKPFDLRGAVFSQFKDRVPMYDPAQFDMRPLSVVLAADGSRWFAPHEAVLDAVRCSIVNAGSVPLRPLLLTGQADPGAGFQRIRLGVARAPAGAFQLRIASPHLGSFRIACAGLPDRATVVSIVVRPDGTFDVGLNLLRVPVDYQYEPAGLPGISYGRVLRDLQLGRKLYESGELMRSGAPTSSSAVLNLLLDAKWTDPILGCMGYYALRRTAQPGDSGAGRRAATATNLNAFFGELPDSRVIYALDFEVARAPFLDALLDRGDIPVLAESCRVLARHAQDTQRADAPIVDIVRRIPTNHIWALHFE